MDSVNVARELGKISDVLDEVYRYLSYENMANAALHMSNTVRYSPLTVAVSGALEDLNRLIAELGE